jgi:hypothetical protein
MLARPPLPPFTAHGPQRDLGRLHPGRLVVALARLAGGDTAIFGKVLTRPVRHRQDRLRHLARLVGVMSLWLGLMKVGEKAHMIELFARAIGPAVQAPCSRRFRAATRRAAAS